MRIDEVSNLKSYLAQVRAGGNVARTSAHAETLTQARAIFFQLFGAANVLSVSQAPDVTNEAGTIKPKSPAELRVKSLADQAAHLKQQEKAARAQIGLKKAQSRVQQANLPAKHVSAGSRRP